MVTTVTSYTDTRNRALVSEGFDGVVRLVLVNPNYDTSNSNSDLALVWLSQDVPLAAQRYGIYRSSSEIGQTMTMLRYGVPGYGLSGSITTFNLAPVRLKANNQFDA